MRTYKGTLNHVGLIGRLKAVPTVHESAGKHLVATLYLATDMRKRNGQGDYDDAVDWHTVVVFGDHAEFVRDHAHAGMRLFVEGKLQTREESYQDKSGQSVKRVTTEIVASQLGPMDAIQSQTKEKNGSSDLNEQTASQVGPTP